MPKNKEIDISWINPDEKKSLSNKFKYKSALETIGQDADTYEDVKEGPALIRALAKKYKQNPTVDIKKWKESFIEAGRKVPNSWRNTGGVTTKSNTVNKVYRPMGKE